MEGKAHGRGENGPEGSNAREEGREVSLILARLVRPVQTDVSPHRGGRRKNPLLVSLSVTSGEINEENVQGLNSKLEDISARRNEIMATVSRL